MEVKEEIEVLDGNGLKMDDKKWLCQVYKFMGDVLNRLKVQFVVDDDSEGIKLNQAFNLSTFDVRNLDAVLEMKLLYFYLVLGHL